jgi:hypothetical protein
MPCTRSTRSGSTTVANQAAEEAEMEPPPLRRSKRKTASEAPPANKPAKTLANKRQGNETKQPEPSHPSDVTTASTTSHATSIGDILQPNHVGLSPPAKVSVTSCHFPSPYVRFISPYIRCFLVHVMFFFFSCFYRLHRHLLFVLLGAPQLQMLICGLKPLSG